MRRRGGRALHVYTDGACLHNGRQGARAGIGVYFGPEDDRNVSEPLEGQPQTNQRAELAAIKCALEITEYERRKVVVHSDSEYAVNCATDWGQHWESNGWRTAKGQYVKNRDLIEPIREMADYGDVEFRWVKGHSADFGNQMADWFAKQGARRNR